MQSFVSLFLNVFRSADVMLWARLLFELFDYMVKAAVHFKDTEEGRKEWEDFASRYEIAINNGANSNVDYSIRSQASPDVSGFSAERVDDPKGGRR